MKAKIAPTGALWEKIKKNKFVLIVVVVGLILIVLPLGGGSGKTSSADGSAAASESMEPDFSLPEQEERMADALSQIDGAGSVTVVLTLKSGVEKVLATDQQTTTKTGGGDTGDNENDSSETTVIISNGSSVQTPIPLKYIYPQYLGALIVAEGADNPTVKLELTQAVSGLLGLGTDKITVIKMKSS